MSDSSGGIERRKQLRRNVRRVSVTFEAGSVRGSGYLKNICKNGVFVRSDAVPDPGTQVRILIEDGEAKAEIHGVVRWTTNQLPDAAEARPGFGIFVPDPSADFLALFEQVLTR